MKCEYCGAKGASHNEYGEAVCLTCELKHHTHTLVDASPAFNPKTKDGSIFISVGGDWCMNGGPQSEPLTVQQARWLIEEIERSIKWIEEEQKCA